MRIVLIMAPWAFVALPVLMAPGVALAIVAARLGAGGDDAAQGQNVYPMILIGSAMVHFIAFFAWYWAPRSGRIFTWAVLGASAVVLLSRWGRCALRAWVADRDLVSSAVLCVGASLMVLGSLLLHGGALHPTDVAAQRWTDARMPPDNVLPAMLADRVIRRAPTEPFFAGWRSSDRPPLQAGAVAFTVPLRRGLTFEQHYQVVSTVLAVQCLGALWALLRRLRASPSGAGAAVLGATASGTLLLNAAYVWPKLLSATLVLAAIIVVLPGTHTPSAPSRPAWVYAGAGSALALLAHGAALFALLPVVLVAVAASAWSRLRRAPVPGSASSGGALGTAQWPAVGLGVGVAGVTMVPWLLYQRLVAPPGDRLLVWHLAGITEPVTQPWYRVVADRYASIGWSGAWHNRIENLSVLANHARLLRDALGWRGATLLLRSLERGHVLNGVGVGWLGMACIPVVLAVPRFRSRHDGVVGAVLIGTAAWCVLVWCALMFGPAGTIPDTSTAVIALLLSAGPILVAAAVDRRLAWLVALLGCVRFTRVWLLAGDLRMPDVSTAAVLVIILGVLMITAGLAVGSRSPALERPAHR